MKARPRSSSPVQALANRRPIGAGPRRPCPANHTHEGSTGVVWALSIGSNVEGLTVKVVVVTGTWSLVLDVSQYLPSNIVL